MKVYIILFLVLATIYIVESCLPVCPTCPCVGGCQTGEECFGVGFDCMCVPTENGINEENKLYMEHKKIICTALKELEQNSERLIMRLDYFSSFVELHCKDNEPEIKILL